jgi:hypothetical protein
VLERIMRQPCLDLGEVSRSGKFTIPEAATTAVRFKQTPNRDTPGEIVPESGGYAPTSNASHDTTPRFLDDVFHVDLAKRAPLKEPAQLGRQTRYPFL